MRAPRFAKSLQYKSGAVQRWAAMRLLEFMLIFELVALRILVIGTTVRLCTPCAHPCHICTGTGLTLATSAPGPGAPLPNRHSGAAIAPALIGACAHYGTRNECANELTHPPGGSREAFGC